MDSMSAEIAGVSSTKKNLNTAKPAAKKVASIVSVSGAINAEHRSNQIIIVIIVIVALIVRVRKNDF